MCVECSLLLAQGWPEVSEDCEVSCTDASSGAAGDGQKALGSCHSNQMPGGVREYVLTTYSALIQCHLQSHYSFT